MEPPCHIRSLLSVEAIGPLPIDCTLRAAPRKALMRPAAMVHRHNVSLGGRPRRILKVIEDHADPDLQPPV